MKKMSIVVATILFVSGGAVAQLSPAVGHWGDTAAKWLMTRDEMKQWKSIRSDADAKKFADLFWARRDPTPATPRNELQEEFNIRVSLADQSFTTAKTKGSLTDRGRAVILLGSPSTVTSRGGGGRVASNAPTNPGSTSGDGTVSVGATRGAGPMITWTYTGEKKPRFIERKDFELLFSDERGGGEYEFAITPRSNPEVFLSAAVRHYVGNPSLTEVPTFQTEVASPAQSTAFRDAALKAAYDKFKAEQKPVGTAHLTWGEYVTPEGDVFVPVSLFVPASAQIPSGKKVTFFGAVENAAGEIVQILEEEATLIASGRDAYVDKSLTLAPGTYKAAFGVAADGQALALTSTELTVEGLKAGDPAVSQLILSNNAVPLAQAQRRTDPYTFGGLKVVPKGDAVFATTDELWYFLEMRNPGLSDTGAPKVMVKLDINGKTVAGKSEKMDFPLAEVETLPLKGVPNHFALVQAFPLAGFEPGLYSVKIKVIDSVLKKTYQMEKQFEVRKF